MTTFSIFYVMLCLLLNCLHHQKETLVLNINQATRDNSCALWFDSHFSYTKDVDYLNATFGKVIFNSFTELNTMRCRSYINPTVDVLSMRPTSRRLLYGYDFESEQFLRLFTFPAEIRVMFSNLRGFNLKWPQTQSTVQSSNIDVSLFTQSRFDFYLNETTLITHEHCVSNNSKQSIFAGNKVIFFGNMLFSASVCPYVLANLRMDKIIFTGLSNSLIFANRLEFMRVNHSKDYLRSYFDLLRIEADFEVISAKIIDKDLFKFVKYILIGGFVYDIQADLFETLRRLKVVHLYVDSFETLLNKGLIWIQSLNANFTSNAQFEDHTRYII